jgi:succinyl-diaminopimelate desuccinylase
MSTTLELLKKLIACPSVTPEDAGCQKIIADYLVALGFNIEWLPFGSVTNLWARYGQTKPLIVFAGHTDVVPPGPLAQWHSDPFTPTERDGLLYGRGAADMKSGLAAMLVAAKNFISLQPKFDGSIGFLLTSDEEGPSIDGTQKVIETLRQRQEHIDYCIIGEASSDQILGDQIRIGRRGSLSGKLTIFGKQGHIAYPHLAANPIHLALKALTELTSTQWDKTTNPSFPSTSFQISNIHAGTGAGNVIPGTMEILFNFRFSTSVSPDELKAAVTKILENNKLHFELSWTLGGQAFLTKQGALIKTVQTTIHELTGLTPILSTGGGTSDGRFIAPTGAEVVELGPLTTSVHQVNEHVCIADLEPLTKIYQCLLERLLLM